MEKFHHYEFSATSIKDETKCGNFWGVYFVAQAGKLFPRIK